MVSADFWCGKRVLVTGHTGFKGSWLSLWLQSMGAKLQGFALNPPTDPNLFVEASVADGMASTTGDIRDFDALLRCMTNFRPEVVLHLAAQSLVRASYLDPVGTYATNVMGTVHVLEAARHLDSVRCVVVVSTDKCYENKECLTPYREVDPVGGHDPYSSSKACVELATASFRRSYAETDNLTVATARAGNVIGGGDWAQDRLVPDLLRAFARGETAMIRNPLAIRPWQHVLEPLQGYLLLAEHLWTRQPRFADAWNFGPAEEDARNVQWITERVVRAWGGGVQWQHDGIKHPHEAHYLRLDSTKALRELAWAPRWNLESAIDRTVAWERARLRGADARACSVSDIREYVHGIQPVHA